MRRNVITVSLILAVLLGLFVVSAFAGGDKNTHRGSGGDQIGEPAPEPAQEPEQPRTGDPNPDQENVPPK